MKQKKVITTGSADETKLLGECVGKGLRGGEVFEFISDLGGGKTTFVRGLAKGFGSSDPVASPTFTISYVYSRDDGQALHHFDFYRLNDPGVVAQELAEVINNKNDVVAIEWGEVVQDVIPADHITVFIKATSDHARSFEFSYPEKSSYLFDEYKGGE